MTFMDGKYIDDTENHEGIFSPETREYFTIGEDTFPCISKAIVQMKRGQIAELICPAHMVYGSKGYKYNPASLGEFGHKLANLTDVPPNTPIKMTLKVMKCNGTVKMNNVQKLVPLV
jgi:hypothetical protein